MSLLELYTMSRLSAIPYQHQHNPDYISCLKAGSNTQVELHPNVNIARHLHDLGEIYRLLCCLLQVCDREDLETGLVDLETISDCQGKKGKAIPIQQLSPY